MKALISIAMVVLAGCGSNEETAPPVPPPLPPPPPRYEVHEWGLIGTTLATEQQYATAWTTPPCDHPRVGDTFGSFGGLGHHGTGRGGGKPILYFHLDGAESLRVTTTVRAPGGRFVERWPAPTATGDAEAISWTAEIKRGACAPIAPPTSASPECQGVPDGYCEAAELASYVTADDGACVVIDGRQHDFLFYRADVGRARLPLEVTLGADGVATVRNTGTAVPIGRILRVKRDPANRTATLSVSVGPPAAGASVQLPPPSPPSSATAMELHAMLEDLGLSAPEIAAFESAWIENLLGPRPPPAPIPGGEGTIGLGNLGTIGGSGGVRQGALPPPPEVPTSPAAPATLQPATDAILYFLPAETAQALLPLTFDPPPAEVSRAILVRVSLVR